MDREPEGLQLLGKTGIVAEDFKMLRSRGKLVGSLLLVLSFAIMGSEFVLGYLCFQWNPMPYLMETASPAGVRITKEQAELLNFLVAYVVFVLTFSFLCTAAVVCIVAASYTEKEISFVPRVMSFALWVWKRIILTFLLFILLVIFQFACTVVLFNFNLAVHEFCQYVITALLVCGYVYIGIMWRLAYATSVLEVKYGVRARSRSPDLIKGKPIMALLLDLFYLMLVGVIAWLLAYGVLNGDRHGVGSARRGVYGTVLVGSLCFVHLMWLLTQSVLYFVCKSDHPESIDKPSLSDQPEGNLGDYEPLESSYAQLEDVHASV